MWKLKESDRCAFLIFQDRKTVLFFTSALQGTMSKNVMYGNKPEAISLVHGLSPIKRWVNGGGSTRKVFMVPQPVSIYNRYMNGVDCVDQIRAVCPTMRKEKRANRAYLTFFLDMCVNNAQAVLSKINPEGEKTSSPTSKNSSTPW